MSFPALLSIHDVMPETMPQVAQIIDQLRAASATAITLLVVPGRDWQPDQLDTLRRWQQQDDIEFAGHGWLHECAHIRGWKHRMHSTFVSRNVAEHLALRPHEVGPFIARNFAWFDQQNLVPPALYVPPAWAMGPISREQLCQLPFRFFETEFGVWDGHARHAYQLPVVGYEADTQWRKLAVRTWNKLNILRASSRRPLRISIHPFDYQYLVADDIACHLSMVTHWLHYSQLATT